MNNVHEDEPVVFETRWCPVLPAWSTDPSTNKTLMDPMRAERLSAALSNDVKPEEEAFGNRPCSKAVDRCFLQAFHNNSSPFVV